ncbi:hypothetical protein Pcinc_034165 [Petrolisthes cinctipes]|uniref:Uncharacterized protein n=1 Tax=Petrolisthes cinctipes TaxID=88211 RepID=A0AAE1EQX2_PETCI|nr:hypothetical protein Pcinc_034165 [Petrolisthes cinctipes]
MVGQGKVRALTPLLLTSFLFLTLLTKAQARSPPVVILEAEEEEEAGGKGVGVVEGGGGRGVGAGGGGDGLGQDFSVILEKEEANQKKESALIQMGSFLQVTRLSLVKLNTFVHQL